MVPLASPSGPAPAAPGLPLDTQPFLAALQRDLGDWVNACLQAADDALFAAQGKAVGADDRVALGEAGMAIRRHRTALAARLKAELVRVVADDLAGRDDGASDAGATGPATLTLLDDGAIDEQIALSRVAQRAEATHEPMLRELAALCSRLRGHADLRLDANPLRPPQVAQALRAGLSDIDLPDEHRLVLLRELANVAGARLGPLCERQVQRLREWGVRPAEFRVQVAPAVVGDRRGAGAAEGATAGTGPGGIASFGAPRDLQTVQTIALFEAAAALPPLAPDIAARVQALVELLARQRSLGDGARQLLHRLDQPVQRLAAKDPSLWERADHPLWQLLDRLVSAGSVHDDFDSSRPGPVGAALERAVSSLVDDPAPDSARVHEAVRRVDEAMSTLLDEQAGGLHEQAERMAGQVDQADAARRLRQQLVQQVRSANAPAQLNRFVLGPWANALEQSARHHGVDSVPVRLQAELVDQLFDLATRGRDERVPLSRLTHCLTHVRLGLEDSGLSAARISGELALLRAVLARPWDGDAAAVAAASRATSPGPTPAAPAPVPDASFGPADDSVAAAEASLPGFVDTQPLADSSTMGLHDALPTVPMDHLDGSEAAATPHTDSWLDALAQGAYCRMYLCERWMNTQLVWRNPRGSMFVFASRHGGRTHSLSRRSLHKLRAAGLATSIERGQFVARVMRELAGG